MAAWMDGLNPAQRDAVTHAGGPLLIVAGAGTGKTLTLASRVAWLIEQGTLSQRILLLTFSRRASREMLSRAARLTGVGSTGKVWGGTFHAVGNRLLRMYGRGLGIRPDFTVMDQADSADMMNFIRGELGLGRGERRFPRKETLASIYSRTVNARTRLREVVEREFPWCAEEVDGIRSVFQAYVERKRSRNVLDYDDLLLYWQSLATTPSTAGVLAGLFDHVLVDEYQDTNALQGEILRGMRPGDSAAVTAVGDDAQAIYAFRSATNRNILDFPATFPGTRVVLLEQNYRSTSPILAATNAVIAASPERYDKELWTAREGERRPELVTCLDESDQADLVCANLLAHRERGVPLHRQAVLFRAAHHSDLLEVELSRRNIPFVKYGGLKFLEAAHVKDVMSVLRILENPYDEVAWFRVLQLIEGIGPAAARRLIGSLGVHLIDGQPSEAADSPLRALVDRPPAVPPGAAKEFAGLRTLVADCLEASVPPGAEVERARRFLTPIIERSYPNAGPRLKDLEQLELLAGNYRSRGAFLADLTLDPPSSTGDLAGPPHLDEDYVVLSTIHSAKGLEWDVVHLIHTADGMIPSDMATGGPESIEEERRLLYVALTRARDALHVSFPLRYYRRPRGLEDPHSYAQVSRFLTPNVHQAFDVRSTAGAGAVDEPIGGRAVDGDAGGVDAVLAALWE